MQLEFKIEKFVPPEGVSVILGQSHFIKTVEDLYEALITSATNIKFGIAFCESSGPTLVRYDGNDKELTDMAVDFARRLAAGHVFVVLIKNAWPINVLDKIKKVDEIVTLYAATSNSLQVILVETDRGRGVVSVIDGMKTKGVETEKDKEKRHKFLRDIGYKK
ncbi:MAG: adenosine-specific kinase [Candidatus Njordarchaeia archaeon]